MNPIYRISAMLLGAAIAGSLAAQTVTLTPLPSGAMRKIGYYYPQHVELSATKPACLKTAPAGLTAPTYGVIKIQGKELAVIVDRAADGTPKLYIDSNGDGDLTNDPATDWKGHPYKSRDGSKDLKNYIGSATVDISLGGKVTPATIGVYVFDPNDTDRPANITHSLFYYADYACEGKMQLGGKSYDFILDDLMATGSFSGGDPSARGGSGVQLIIDREGNGKFDTRGDAFDAKKPFNIGGTTYELTDIASDGASFKLGKSSQTVPEVPLMVSLHAGSKALAFAATTTSGKHVQFPTDYKGKIVMLDFWATWCGPCMGEVPNVVATYNKYHDQGFEILGISLDNDKTAKDVPSVTHDKGMSWMQVCDAKYWDAAVAKLYSVQGIPQAYVVDGDTGEILAEGDAIRGDALAKAIETALAKKHARK